MTNPNFGPLLRARAATDGDRVQINRVIGPHSHDLDPFLLIDYSRLAATDDAATLPRYPAHPHRGLEIIQYVLEGELEHRDNLGNHTRVRSGDVQWLSTASGMIHEEVPGAVERVVSLSIWINMAAAQKDAPASYRHLPAQHIPKLCLDGVFYKALCGAWQLGETTLRSPIDHVAANTGLLHIEMSPASEVQLPLNGSEQYYLYLFHGELRRDDEEICAQRGVLLRLKTDAPLKIRASAQGASLLLMKGRRIAEPLVQYGPFAMNSQQQIMQALQDYRQINMDQQLPH